MIGVVLLVDFHCHTLRHGCLGCPMEDAAVVGVAVPAIENDADAADRLTVHIDDLAADELSRLEGKVLRL